jgi:hypothetical protein
MQGYNLTVTNVKLIPAYTDCGRSLSPTFDLQNTSGNTLLYLLLWKRNWTLRYLLLSGDTDSDSRVLFVFIGQNMPSTMTSLRSGASFL